MPSRLELLGLNRVDGKRPDGVTTVPWKCGKLLVWDATCPDMFAPSYVSQATTAAGEVATHAEERKCSKYSSLPVTHDFIPVAIETSGVMGPQSLHFLRELGRRDRLATHLLPLTCSNASQLPSRGETQLALWGVLGAMTSYACHFFLLPFLFHFIMFCYSNYTIIIY